MKARAPNWRTLLLSTKLFAPPPRANRVLRPRLSQRLDDALRPGHRLALIAAPAGFGKTTVVSDWLGTLGAPSPQPSTDARPKFSWLTLDESDNDPARFLTYLLAAVEPLVAQSREWDALVQRLSNFPMPPAETILTPVLNQLTFVSPASRLLILDDYHVIHATDIHNALAFLIEHLPPHVHVIITTRTDPPLPLARWHARGALSVLRADDLTFSREEAATFLNTTMRLNLNASEIDALETRTQGWIAGLQLAGIALTDAEQGQLHEKDRARFISAFAGTHRVVSDYLMEEVLQRQSPQVQQFLMQTSIVERLSAPLCAALVNSMSEESGGSTERAHVQLQELERAHLFLAPLDAAHEWYRYHPLWLDALRHRLVQIQPARVRELHLTASRWFESHQLFGEAVHHAFAAQDVERAAEIVDANAGELINRNEFALLREWFAQLPPTVFETRPRLCLQRAWFLFLTGARQQAEQWITLAERALASHPPEAGEANIVASQIETVRSAVQLEIGNYHTAIEHAARAQTLLQLNNEPMRAAPQMYHALAKFWSGQVQGVDVELAEAAQRALASGNLFFAMTAACHQGEVLMTQGRLHEALTHFRALEEQARQWGIEHRPYVALLHVNWGMLYFEVNDLDACRAAFERAMELSDFGSAPREWLISAAFLAWIYFLLGNRARSMDLVARGEAHLRQYQIPAWASSHLIDTKQGLDIWDRDFQETQRWLEQNDLGITQAPDYVNELAQLTLSRVKIMHQDYSGALHIARRLCEAAEQSRRIGSLPRLYTVEALMYARSGDQAQALERLDRALDVGEGRNFVRSIIDEGYTIEELLATMLAKPRPHDTPERQTYIRRLLASAQRDRFITTNTAAPPSVVPTPKTPAPRAPESTESLDGPEMRVLQLLAEGYSNREISEKLGVGVGVIKTNINNLFRKLDAQSRTQALQRAREMGLIAS